MSKRTFRNYTPEFRQEAIKLALNSSSVVSAAKDLGILAATLYSWIENAKKRGEVVSNSSSEPIKISEIIKENQELKNRLARFEQEKTILKKAAAYFASVLE